MKVILLEDVKSLGKKGDLVNVSDGYARNMILPKKLGVEATPKNLNDLKLQKANDEKVAKENLEAAQAFAKGLEGKEVVLTLKVGEGGKTFGSIAENAAQRTKTVAYGAHALDECVGDHLPRILERSPAVVVLLH